MEWGFPAMEERITAREKISFIRKSFGSTKYFFSNQKKVICSYRRKEILPR